jgi:hypothetical protein
LNNAALFALGVFVMLLVGTSLSLLIWGAILDGRDEHDRRAAARDTSERRTIERTPSVVDAA